MAKHTLNTKLIPLLHHEVLAVRSFLNGNHFYEIFPSQVINSLGHPGEKAFHVTVQGEKWCLQQGCRYYLLNALSMSRRVYTLISSFRKQTPSQDNRTPEFKYLETAFEGSLNTSKDMASGILMAIIDEVLNHSEECLSAKRIRYLKSIRLPLPNLTFERAVASIGLPADRPLGLKGELSLIKKHNGQPVIITDYPIPLKPNIPSTRWHKNQKTLLNFSIVAPFAGSIIDGGVYETARSKLEDQMTNSAFGKALRRRDPSLESLHRYMQAFDSLRSQKSYSFMGLGVERIAQFAIGKQRIEDATFCPLFPGGGRISMDRD